MRTIETIKAEIKAVTDKGRKLNALQNEGGDGYDHTDNARLTALTDELWDAEQAAWTPEVTAARREDWYAEMRKHARITPAILAATQRKLGYTLSDLRSAVKRNNLK